MPLHHVAGLLLMALFDLLLFGIVGVLFGQLLVFLFLLLLELLAFLILLGDQLVLLLLVLLVSLCIAAIGSGSFNWRQIVRMNSGSSAVFM